MLHGNRNNELSHEQSKAAHDLFTEIDIAVHFVDQVGRQEYPELFAVPMPPSSVDTEFINRTSEQAALNAVKNALLDVEIANYESAA